MCPRLYWATYTLHLHECSAVETQDMKLQPHSFYADVNVREDLEVCSY